MINYRKNKKKETSDKLKLTHYKIIKSILLKEFANYKTKFNENFKEKNLMEYLS